MKFCWLCVLLLFFSQTKISSSLDKTSSQHSQPIPKAIIEPSSQSCNRNQKARGSSNKKDYHWNTPLRLVKTSSVLHWWFYRKGSRVKVVGISWSFCYTVSDVTLTDILYCSQYFGACSKIHFWDPYCFVFQIISKNLILFDWQNS